MAGRRPNLNIANSAVPHAVASNCFLSPKHQNYRAAIAAFSSAKRDLFPA